MSLRSHYNQAANAFLYKNLPATSQSLAAADELLSSTSSAGHDGGELVRKLNILKITFYATAYGLTHASAGIAEPYASTLARFDGQAGRLVAELYSTILLAGDPSPDILPSPAAAEAHPSLAIALVLAAIKVDALKESRQVAENWFASQSQQTEGMIAQLADEADKEGHGAPVDGSTVLLTPGKAGKERPEASTVSLPGTSASGVLPPGSPGGSATPTPEQALLKSWYKLLHLLVLHVLPGLEEWEDAKDWVKVQGTENGGWVPGRQVENLVSSIDKLKTRKEAAAMSESRMEERQKARAVAAVEADRKRSSSSRKSKKSNSSGESNTSSSNGNGEGDGRRSKGKGPEDSSRTSKSSSSDTRNSESPPSTSEGRRRQLPHERAPPTGLAAVRSHLSHFLRRGHDDTGRPRNPPAALTLNTVLRYLDRNLDPLLRLLSMFSAFWFLVAVVRRRLARRRLQGLGGLGVGDAVRGVVTKVGETVKMGTKVTTL